MSELERESELERKYDEQTCVTAETLRALGISVPEQIPDVAWIKKDAVRIGPLTLSELDLSAGKLQLNYEVSFTQPFHWFALSVTRSADGIIQP